MTATPIAEPPADDALFCYRHPDRQTWVSCGRCDRPICTSCAMQGPVGLRCKTCGKPAFDPLTSFTPVQLVLGTLTALVAGVVTGYVANRIGFFSIFVAYFAGAIIADLVARVTGYKRGPVMLAIVFGGIAVGVLVGALAAFSLDYGAFLEAVAAEDAEAAAAYPLRNLIVDAATWALVSVGAACFGAWTKLR
jgi:hypothetical protein